MQLFSYRVSTSSHGMRSASTTKRFCRLSLPPKTISNFSNSGFFSVCGTSWAFQVHGSLSTPAILRALY